MSRSGRDIGDLPAVVNPKRKAACRRSLKKFLETYRADTFKLKWSKDHLDVISKLERCILSGGLFAVAMPRGSGKTSITEGAGEWAYLYGHRRFTVIISSDKTAGESVLDSIRTEIECNPLYAEDFPEICYPIACLEGIANRCNGQTYQGDRTRIRWTGDTIAAPTIKGSKASGAMIMVAGLTGGFRGLKHKTAEGSIVRPDFVILDDPQTDESARSPKQNEDRERIISGAVLGLAGPGKKIAAVMPCTVIVKGDMADRILDRKLHPYWQGVRTKLLYSPPENDKLWNEYQQILEDELLTGGDGSQATAFYKKNRKRMDKGAKPAWPERYDEDEISAVQNAMNIKLRDPAAFAAEYQNEPLEDEINDQLAKAEDVAVKITSTARGEVPLACTKITAFVDVQEKVLWWTVAAWDEHFGGGVIDYGAFPEQSRRYFTLGDVRQTLRRAYPGTNRDGSIYKGVQALLDQLMGRVWHREDGATMPVDLALVDANWGATSNVVYQAIHDSVYASRVFPSHGRGITASSIPMSDYRRQPGERVGLNWRIPNIKGKRTVRHVVYDTNFWKAFIHSQLKTPLGQRGCLSLFKGSATVHRMFSEQVTAESAVKTSGRNRELLEFKPPPDRRDNHFLDCLTGCAVAASAVGVATLDQQRRTKTPAKKRRPHRERVSQLNV